MTLQDIAGFGREAIPKLVSSVLDHLDFGTSGSKLRDWSPIVGIVGLANIDDEMRSHKVLPSAMRARV